MIIDGNLLFDGSGAPLAGVAVTSTRTSTNQLDLLNGRDLGVGDDPALKVLCRVIQAFAGAGATLNVQFQAAPDNGSGAPGTYVTLAESGAIPVASLVAGANILNIDVPRMITPAAPGQMPRFYQLNYVVSGGPFTAGSVIAGIVLDRGSEYTYPPGVVVNN